jgi:hypothetical protein
VAVFVRKLELGRKAITGGTAHTNNNRNTRLLLLKCIDKVREFAALLAASSKQGTSEERNNNS